MSDASESKPLLDLSELKLVPKWVSDFSKTPSRTDADFGDSDTTERRGPRDRDQRGGGGGAGRGAGGYGDQRGGPPRGRTGPGGPPRGDARSGGGRDDRRGPGGPGGGRDRDRRSYGRDDRGPSRPAYDPGPQPVAGLKVHVEPDLKATEAMAAMIRTAGKAYSVFDAARLVLASGDRFHVKFSLAADNPQKLYAVPSQSSLWLSKEDALNHFIDSPGINDYYRVDEIELEAPKGNFASIAVCGMCGELLGPPSHHSYQASLHRIHREKFTNMNFEDYKRRVRTDSSPEAIEKWKAAQTHGRQWVALKESPAEGAEPTVLKSRAEMEAHFRKHYADSLVREVSEATVTGNIPKNLLAVSLYLHLRGSVEEARKHLLQTAQQLCSAFEQQGLKLFKRRGGKLWVSRTRPRTLDAGTVLSERIAKIIEVVKNKPGIATKELVEVLSPSANPPAAPDAKEGRRSGKKGRGPKPAEAVAAPAPESAEEAAVAVAAVEAPVVPEEIAAPDKPLDAAIAADAPVSEVALAEVEPAAEEAAPVPAPAAAGVDTTPEIPAEESSPTLDATAPHGPTDEQLLVLKDLHWLNSEGYVIEYADGIVFPGVTEPPPPKPKPVKEAAPAKDAASTADTAVAAAPTTGVEGEEVAATDSEAEPAPALKAAEIVEPEPAAEEAPASPVADAMAKSVASAAEESEAPEAPAPVVAEELPIIEEAAVVEETLAAPAAKVEEEADK